MIKIPKYPIYELGYNNQYPIEQLFVFNHDIIPSKYSDNNFYNKDFKDYLIKNDYTLISEQINSIKEISFKDLFSTNNNNRYSTNYYFYTNSIKKTFITLVEYNDLSYKYTLYYDAKKNIKNVINFDEIKNYVIKNKKYNVNLITNNNGHLDVEEFDLKIGEVDILLNYGESFQQKHDIIVNKLSEENGKGLVLLHGKPGTGKSFYLKYLTSKIDKEILFVPPSMSDSLSDPSFISFLMRYRNSILFIEEGEKIIQTRENNNNTSAISNLLNLTDGILSDCLGIQVVLTFNTAKENIDKALMRKGRLITEHYFDELNVENSNTLLKHLNKNYVTSTPMTLTDIYNIDEELLISTKNNKKIGF